MLGIPNSSKFRGDRVQGDGAACAQGGGGVLFLVKEHHRVSPHVCPCVTPFGSTIRYPPHRSPIITGSVYLLPKSIILSFITELSGKH